MSMKIIATTILFLVLASAASAQQHAPTLDVCQADVAVWYSPERAAEYNNAQARQMQRGVRNRNEYTQLPIKEVVARMKEMADCWEVADYTEVYFKAHLFFHSIYSDRMIDFISRHHLWEQFRSEDAAGAR